jgi:hypothetical protein
VSTGERKSAIKTEKNRRSIAWRDRRDNSNTAAAYGDVQVDGFIASTSATAELDAAPLRDRFGTWLVIMDMWRGDASAASI